MIKIDIEGEGMVMVETLMNGDGGNM